VEAISERLVPNALPIVMDRQVWVRVSAPSSTRVRIAVSKVGTDAQRCHPAALGWARRWQLRQKVLIASRHPLCPYNRRTVGQSSLPVMHRLSMLPVRLRSDLGPPGRQSPDSLGMWFAQQVIGQLRHPRTRSESQSLHR
jgi:hypothetical protein